MRYFFFLKRRKIEDNGFWLQRRNIFHLCADLCCRDAILRVSRTSRLPYFASPVLRVSRTSRLPYFASPVLRVSHTSRLPYFASPVLRVSRTSRLPYFASPVLRVSRTVSPTSPSLIYPSEAQLFAASHWLYLPYPEIAAFPCTF